MMLTTREVEIAAQQLRQATETRQTCSPIRELIGETDLVTAYAIQEVNTQLRLEAGQRIIGSKIGLTSVAVQKQLGVDQPDYGFLFDTMEVLNGAEIPWTEVMQPKVEAEIAFVLGRDLPSSDIGVADVLSAIDYAVASLEIVGSRIEGWNIRITDTIADNASASHFVIGHRPMPLRKFDVTKEAMILYKNGEEVSEGTGFACLGSPVNATLWLAKTMAELGKPLRAGQVILSGAMGPMSAVEPGDSFKVVFDTLGEVVVSFGKE